MTDAITKTGPSALARPEFIPQGDTRGTEGIKREDLQMPRLALAQALSPELDESNPKYIAGLKNGDAFNNLTGEVYGKKPIDVVVVRVDAPRYIEFFPREAGGGIKDFNVPADDPRTQFTTNDKDERIKPLATKFIEMVALLGPEREPIALSFKGSGLKAARKLITLINWRKMQQGVPSFATVFTLTPTPEKNQKGSYAVFTVAQKGNVDAETFKFAGDVFESIKDKALAVEREAGDDHAEGGDDSKVPF